MISNFEFKKIAIGSLDYNFEDFDNEYLKLQILYPVKYQRDGLMFKITIYVNDIIPKVLITQVFSKTNILQGKI